MITEYRHTGLVVNNIKKSYQFYCKLLDLKTIQNFIEHGDYFNKLIGEKNLKAKIIKIISPDNIYLELIEFIKVKKKKIKKPKKFTTIGQLHICFTVKNIFSIYKKMKKKKVKFISPPLKSEFDEVKTCFCYDPDFNLVQLVEGKPINKKK